MAKGGLCEKCQKNKATTIFDIQGWRKWTVCHACNLELQTCSKCKKNPATNLITDGKGEKTQVCAECCSKPQEVKCDDCQRKMKDGEQLFLDNNDQGKQINICSDCKSKRGNKPNNKDGELCKKCNKNPQSGKWGTNKWNFCQECLKEKRGYALCPVCNKINFWGFSHSIPGEDISPYYSKGEKWEWKDEVAYQRRKDGRVCCSEECEKKQENQRLLCIKCKKNKICPQNPELCSQCLDNPNDNKDRKPNPGECCEKCGASSIVHETKTSYTWKRKRYIKHKTDFTREETCWFGLNCPCAREFREANQQTCPQCKKREFPHMKRGWMLYYEIKKAFCSPLCHVTYRELKWEEAQRLTQLEMFPPELDVSVNPGDNIDWEKEGLKIEVLFLRETVRELEASLNNQTNLTPEEQQQSNYLRNLQQNTLRNAENNYQSRYGALNEDGSDKGKGMGGGVIFLLAISGMALVGVIAYFLTRTKKKEKKVRW